MNNLSLKPNLLTDWPKLAWVAQYVKNSQVIKVYHGPMVEVSHEWIVEAVWDGEFSVGNFDQTDLVFGTGIRLREKHVAFVSSGSVFDRLLYCETKESWFFSNSLPALLAVADLNLRSDYLSYSNDIRTVSQGLERRNKLIPTDGEYINSVFFNNLIFNGREVVETEKDDSAPYFKTFDDYYNYLIKTATLLGENSTSPLRQNCVTSLSSISSGYDSCAAAAISCHAGCKETVSIKESSSLWRGSDSGAHIAKILGMSCKEYGRTLEDYPMEEAIWAAEGRPGILNWTQFDFPEPLCLFFTGCHGEKLWDRVNHDHPDPFVRRDTSSLGFCEFRLIKGVFQCPLPFWGVRHSQELHAITAAPEMKPWYMNKDYDKPIARRIIEKAGVPRKAFGTLNKNTSLEKSFWWPLSSVSKEKFHTYLKEKNVFSPSKHLVQLITIISQLDAFFYKNIIKKLGIKKGQRPWSKLKANALIFPWANKELQVKYKSGFKKVD